ncbi:MAG TPA: diacylglycerol kinase family protein [Streptosporangiaceae bacterium]|jgi:diacylglycerol kinase family enzyme
MTRTCCLVVNPAAGGGRSQRLLPKVTGVLDAAGVRHVVRASASLRHAAELAAAAAGRGETVVAFGGDGMVGTLAAAVAAAGGVFGIVPAGRGNDFARTLGIPFSLTEAADRLVTGQERAVDLIGVAQEGRAPGGELVVAGSVYLGIPAVAAQIAVGSRFPPGALAYPVAALRAVAGWRPARFRLELDGEPGQGRTDLDSTDQGGTGSRVREFAGGAVVVANSRYFGAGMMVAPDADTGDGLLDVLYIQGSAKPAMIHALTKIKKGGHVTMRPVGSARAGAVTVSADRAMPGGADGEPLGCAAPLEPGTRLVIRALPGVLRVIS